MGFSIVIPAQKANKYHKFGDLAPFGDTTLLEWKISQCKEFSDSCNIFINSDSEVIENIAEKEEVNFIKRNTDENYEDVIFNTLNYIDTEDLLWINPTSPFMNASLYINMYNNFKNNNLDSIVSVEKKKEYIFFKDKKLNFADSFVSRKEIEPIYIMTNGCYIVKKDLALNNKNLILSNPNFFEIDSFSSIEIKDVHDYTIARELISIYFRKEFDV